MKELRPYRRHRNRIWQWRFHKIIRAGESLMLSMLRNLSSSFGRTNGSILLYHCGDPIPGVRRKLFEHPLSDTTSAKF
jgi:hypothetical protein